MALEDGGSNKPIDAAGSYGKFGESPMRIARILSLIALLCGTGATQAADIRIGWQTGVVNTLLTYAQQNGLFKEVGLAVELKPFAAGPAMLPAFAAGEIDVGWMGEFPAVTGFVNGLPIRLFLVQSMLRTDVRLVANSAIGAKTISDLKGRKVAVTIGSTSHFHLLRALDLAGLTQTDVTMVNLAPANMAPAYLAGQVDAILTWEPGVGEVEAQGAKRIATTESLGTVTGLFGVVREDYLKSRSQEVGKLIKAWDAALAAYAAAPRKVIESEAARLGQPVEAVEALLARQNVTFPGFAEQVGQTYLGSVVDKRTARITSHVQDIAQFLVKIDRIKSVPTNLVDLIEPSAVVEYLGRPR
jgi:taurine transport system substrate-binding protein